MPLIGLRNILGQKPYAGCQDVFIESLDEAVAFVPNHGPQVAVTHAMVDGNVHALETPVMVGCDGDCVTGVYFAPGRFA